MAEDIVKLPSQPGSPIILVFWPERRTEFPGEHLQRGRKKTRVVGIFFNTIFDWNRRLSWKRYEEGPWLLL